VIRARIPRCRCPEHAVKTVRCRGRRRTRASRCIFESLRSDHRRLSVAYPSGRSAAIGLDGVQRIVDRGGGSGIVAALDRGGALTWGSTRELWPRQRYVRSHRHQRARVLEVVRATTRRPEVAVAGFAARAEEQGGSSSHGHECGASPRRPAPRPQQPLSTTSFHVGQLLTMRSTDSAADISSSRARRRHAQAIPYLWLHGQLPRGKAGQLRRALEITLRRQGMGPTKNSLSSSGDRRTPPMAWTSSPMESDP